MTKRSARKRRRHTAGRYLTACNSIPGIKVDTGAKDLAGAPARKSPKASTACANACRVSRLGARFAKWRAVITIGNGYTQRLLHRTNAHALGRYAALAQEQNIVPIVEPEVLMDGSHSIEQCFEVTEHALKTLYEELYAQGVTLEGTILKPNMVISGTDCPQQAGVEQVAEMTVSCLKRCVPSAVPGICFLSGGQSDEAATAHLSAMNSGFDVPWALSFSYGRALQAAALKAWGGKPENALAAQTAFTHRARMNGLAATGDWTAEMERAA